MERPKQLNIENKSDISCGVYAISIILNALQFNHNTIDIENYAHNIGEGELGALYTRSSLRNLLDTLKHNYTGLEYKEYTFKNSDELSSILRDSKDNGYILIPYYAMQGFVWKHTKPDMKHGHWAVIFDFDGVNIYGIQSNQKADKLGCLNSVSIKSFYESNQCLNRIKIDWGKYNKCNICINKKLLGIKPRCGNTDDCKYTNKADFNCIYNSDIGNTAYLLFRD